MTPIRVQVPPLKSQGIKTKLVPWISQLVPPGFSGKWIEPFMGTGVVGLNLATHGGLLCDSNPHLIAFYSGIASGEIDGRRVRGFLTREGALLSERGEGHYYEVRARFNSLREPLDFLFLNRAGFNGMIRFNKKGGFNIPFCRKPDRFSPAYITKIVNQVDAASILISAKHLEFECQPFEQTISAAKPGDIIYCDPPYIDRHCDYYNQWTHDDEAVLRERLLACGADFILSTWLGNRHRRNIAADQLWNGTRRVTREHFYHVGARLDNRSAMTEALLFSDGLQFTDSAPEFEQLQLT